MKKIIYALTVFLLISYSVLSNETEKKDLELTENQIKTINLINLMTGIDNAEWINPYTIEVTVDAEIFSIDNKKQNIKSGNELVKSISGLGYEITKENTCVKIMHPIQGELAYNCSGNQTGI